MISTNFITGTGFIKMHADHLGARLVTAATAGNGNGRGIGGQHCRRRRQVSSCLKMVSLRSMFSVAASPPVGDETPWAISVKVVRFGKGCFFLFFRSRALAIWRSKFFEWFEWLFRVGRRLHRSAYSKTILMQKHAQCHCHGACTDNSYIHMW